MDIKTKLKFLRTESGMTQKELSKLAEVPYPTIQKYERGLFQPQQPNIDKMAAAFGISALCFQDLPDILNSSDRFALLALPISERLKTIRLSAAYNQLDFATTIVCHAANMDSIVLSDPTLKKCLQEIKQIENGEIQPDKGLLWNIAEALSIPFDALDTEAKEETDNDQPLTNLFNLIKQLNTDGIQKVEDYVIDISALPKYRK